MPCLCGLRRKLLVLSQLARALPALPRADPGCTVTRAALPGASTLQYGRGAGLGGAGRAGGARGQALGLAQLGETGTCTEAAALLTGLSF